MIDEAQRQFDAIIRSLTEAGEKVLLLALPGSVPEETRKAVEGSGGSVIADVPFNDTWTRDYGPITAETGEGALLEIDFGFNGWGLKFAADRDNLVNLRMVERAHRAMDTYLNRRDFILEGGSIESDGKGTILTTSRCLCSPNRNGGKSKDELEPLLKEMLGAERVLWVDHGFLEGDDTDSHIDTLARLAPEDTIVYVAPPEDTDDIHRRELELMEAELAAFRTKEVRPYRLIALPFADPVYDEEGRRLPATYANYLVTGSNLYMPTYDNPEKDRKALEAVGRAFPGHIIHTVDCRTLIRQHGSLHCSTMQLYT